MVYEVECYSGTRYGERPRALLSEGHRIEITEIVNSWRSPAGVIFQVLTEDGLSFELTFEEATGQWSVKEI